MIHFTFMIHEVLLLLTNANQTWMSANGDFLCAVKSTVKRSETIRRLSQRWAVKTMIWFIIIDELTHEKEQQKEKSDRNSEIYAVESKSKGEREKRREGRGGENKLIETISSRPVVLVVHCPLTFWLTLRTALTCRIVLLRNASKNRFVFFDENVSTNVRKMFSGKTSNDVARLRPARRIYSLVKFFVKWWRSFSGRENELDSSTKNFSRCWNRWNRKSSRRFWVKRRAVTQREKERERKRRTRCAEAVGEKPRRLTHSQRNFLPFRFESSSVHVTRGSRRSDVSIFRWGKCGSTDSDRRWRCTVGKLLSSLRRQRSDVWVAK